MCIIRNIYILEIWYIKKISELVKKGEKALSNFIDAIAVLLITSCAIPVIVLLFLIWIIKMIFGINISIPKRNKKINENELDKKND